MTDFFQNIDFFTYFQVVAIDLVMSGDNAVVIGMAVAGLPEGMRRRAILIGILAAAGLRIALSLVAVQLLAIPGILLAGGLMLLYVCWSMYRELSSGQTSVAAVQATNAPQKTMRQAVTQIVLADVSMSLDNVLAVAGAARNDPNALIFGLVFSVALMALASTLVARLLARYRWIGWGGLAIILYIAGSMLYEGGQDVRHLMMAIV